MAEGVAVSRRTFLSGLVTLFGASSADGLTKRIHDLGKPTILNPWAVEKTLHVYEGGVILFGGPALADSRPTWRELLAVEGLPVNDPEQIPRILAEKCMETEDELDQPSIALLVNSVPLSLITIFGFPLTAMIRSSSRTTRWSDKDGSAMRPIHYPVR